MHEDPWDLETVKETVEQLGEPNTPQEALLQAIVYGMIQALETYGILKEDDNGDEYLDDTEIEKSNILLEIQAAVQGT
jgi:hypothetical protein